MAGFGPGHNGGALATTYTEEQITSGLMAMIAWAGNATAASRYLKQKGTTIPAARLNTWKQVHAARYDELREKFAGEMEQNLAHEMRDVARLALEAERIAIDKATVRLKKGEDQDPGKTAANMARVAQSSTDKLMTLTSRPTQITESRGVQEILRSLAARGVLAIPEGDTDAVEEEPRS